MMLKVAYVLLMMTASTITHTTHVCGRITPELPITSPWSLKEEVFTKTQAALARIPLLFYTWASGSNLHPMGTSHPWDGVICWYPCHAAPIQHQGSSPPNQPKTSLSLFHPNNPAIIFPHESASVFRWTIWLRLSRLESLRFWFSAENNLISPDCTQR